MSMLESNVTVGDKEVVASGSLVIPKDAESATVGVKDLKFNFIFISDGGDPTLSYQGGGKELNIIIKNYAGGTSIGRTRDFMKVGNIGSSKLGLAYTVRVNNNLSRTLIYTFVKFPMELPSVESEAVDE
nr:hypothetical protein [Pseudomonas fluorescens]